MRAPRPHRQPGLPLQARRVGWGLLLVLIVLALTVVASQALLRRQVDSRVAGELRGEVAELRLLAEEGRDPATGGPFTDVADVLDLHLRRSLPCALRSRYPLRRHYPATSRASARVKLPT